MTKLISYQGKKIHNENTFILFYKKMHFLINELKKYTFFIE